MMQTVIDVRMMTEADIPAVLEIQDVCYTEVTPESDASLHAKLSASQSTCFIASLDDCPFHLIVSICMTWRWRRMHENLAPGARWWKRF